ncbi:MAG: S41 family peptidase [Bacteroidales bacterium]
MKPALIPLYLLFLLIITACEKENDSLENSSSDVNSWIYSEMKNNYLWLDEIKELNSYNNSDSPETFFNSLISENEKKKRNGQTYWYSYMEKRTALTKVSEYPKETYGIEYVFYVIRDGIYFARVLYVLPGSPADKAGVCRGMWIKKVNGQSLTKVNRELLARGNGIKLDVYEGRYDTTDDITQQIQVGPQVSMYEHPILKDTVLLGNDGTKIGYMIYNQFTTGPTGFDDKTYNQEMIALFAKFKAAGVREFILDLRYNPGGYLDCALLLSSCLVKASGINKVFCIVDYNPKSALQSKTYNYKDMGNSNLNLDKIYILTGEWTASASEAVINGLKPMMDIVQIGDTTEGKNLGSIAIQNNKYDWILHPIVAKIANAAGEGSYWNGISPTENCLFQELNNPNPLGALGTLDDYMIQMAIKHMHLWDDRSLYSPKQTSYMQFDLKPETSSLSRKSISSIRIN